MLGRTAVCLACHKGRAAAGSIRRQHAPLIADSLSRRLFERADFLRGPHMPLHAARLAVIAGCLVMGFSNQVCTSSGDRGK